MTCLSFGSCDSSEIAFVSWCVSISLVHGLKETHKDKKDHEDPANTQEILGTFWFLGNCGTQVEVLRLYAAMDAPV